MDRNEFTNLIRNHQTWEDKIDEVNKVLDASLWGCEWIQYSNKLFDYILRQNFPSDVCDKILDWLYEELIINGNKIETVDDLWNYVKEYRK